MKPAIILLFFISSCYCSSAQNPNFDWANSIGSTGYTSGVKTVSDAAGNVYILGLFINTVDMDPGPAVFNLTSSGETDVFIAKSDAVGNFLWGKRIGNSANDNFLSMDIDNSGNLYFTGSFYATVDFDPGTGVFNMTCSSSGYAAFLLKLDGDGNFIWAKEIIETGYGNAGTDVAATPAGDVYVSGRFRGTGDFDPGPGVVTLSSTGAVDDVFI